MRTNMTDTFYQPKDVVQQPKAKYILTHNNEYYRVDGWNTKGPEIVEFTVGPRADIVAVIPVRAKWSVVREDYLEALTVKDMLNQNQDTLAVLVGAQVAAMDGERVSQDITKKVRAN